MVSRLSWEIPDLQFPASAGSVVIHIDTKAIWMNARTLIALLIPVSTFLELMSFCHVLQKQSRRLFDDRT